MTATTSPTEADKASESIRMPWMESLGFSDSTTTWSDHPLPTGAEARPLSPMVDTVADWAPREVGAALTKRKVRWGVLASLAIIAGVLVYGGVWLYQRPAKAAAEASASVATQATSLASALPALEEANTSLLDGLVDSDALIAVDQAARSLFNASAVLVEQPQSRAAAADAAGKALDAVRLISDANAYRLAVSPALMAPELETDFEVIALDEAARAFGDWQLGLEEVRNALPEGVLSDVTAQLDVLSENLTNVLEAYIDGLREDNAAAVTAALAGLANELTAIGTELSNGLADVQSRATQRIEDSKQALDLLVG